MTEPYKALQHILGRVRDTVEAARYSTDPHAMNKAVLANQERLAEAMLIIGTLLDTIVDNQVQIVVTTPSKEKRN